MGCKSDPGDRKRKRECLFRENDLKFLRYLVRASKVGEKEYSIRQVGGHLYTKYIYHEASHVLACCLTKNKKKVLKIENKPKNKKQNT